MLSFSLLLLLAPPAGTAADARVAIDASLYLGQENVRAALGVDPGPGVVAVEVTVKPAAGKKVAIDLDHFLIRSDRDGQHGKPLWPSQIAGSAVMVVSSRGGDQGRPISENRGPIYGPPVGGGRPMQLPGGRQESGVATADTSEASASLESNKDKRAAAVLEVLKKKALPEKEIGEPLTGMLYFAIDGKQRPKDLELIYRAEGSKLSVRFKEEKKK
jgi:hypothetical protein